MKAKLLITLAIFVGSIILAGCAEEKSATPPPTQAVKRNQREESGG